LALCRSFPFRSPHAHANQSIRTEEEVFECHSLQAALKRPELSSSPLAQLATVPTQHPREFVGRCGHADNTPAHKQVQFQLLRSDTSLDEDELLQPQLRYASNVVNTPNSTRESTPSPVDTINLKTATATSISALEATTSDTEKESTLQCSIEKPDTKVDTGNSTNQNESPSEISNKYVAVLISHIYQPNLESG